jgi:hypothetical protein
MTVSPCLLRIAGWTLYRSRAMGNLFGRTLGLSLGVMLAACGGGGGGGGGTGPGGAAFSANINGQPWTADANTFTVIGNGGVPGALTISGVEVVAPTDYKSISISVSFIGATGVYPMGINIGTTAGATASMVVVSGNSTTTYLTPLSGAAGTLTITTLTASRMAGTFSFSADLSPGPGAPVSVTNGSFDISIPTGFTSVPPGNKGSTISASLGGTAFNAATVVGLGDLAAGAFSLGGQTVTTSVSITTAAQITAPGTYNLGAEVTMSVLDFVTADAWSSGTGATGTVTITSIGNGRLVGSFDGVLVSTAMGGPSLAVTGGAFDVLVLGP